MVHNHFVLKRSRMATVFQMTSMLIISSLLFILMPMIVWLISTIFLVVTFYRFNRQAKVEYLFQLDQSEWSVQFHNQTKTHRVQLSHFLDHSLYIVVYFSHSQIKNIVIWKDQVDLKAWKTLKSHAKLN